MVTEGFSKGDSFLTVALATVSNPMSHGLRAGLPTNLRAYVRVQYLPTAVRDAALEDVEH